MVLARRKRGSAAPVGRRHRREEEGEQAAVPFQTRSANDILDDGYRWRKYSAHPRFVVRFLDPSLNYYLVSHHSFSSEARGLMGSQYLLALLSLSCNTKLFVAARGTGCRREAQGLPGARAAACLPPLLERAGRRRLPWSVWAAAEEHGSQPSEPAVVIFSLVF